MMLPTRELRGHHPRQCHVPPHFVPAYGVDITNGHPGSTDTDHRFATSSETTSKQRPWAAFTLALPCPSGQIFKLGVSCKEDCRFHAIALSRVALRPDLRGLPSAVVHSDELPSGRGFQANVADNLAEPLVTTAYQGPILLPVDSFELQSTVQLQVLFEEVLTSVERSRPGVKDEKGMITLPKLTFQKSSLQSAKVGYLWNEGKQGLLLGQYCPQ
ncbi:hypothetical protein B0I37DRAFT_10295 [Chaetomium sp. MPI-CAGE-AT-0009]|nr:hypothetical protein B0I37DRAFT_10295 [Chaetomium sp. MPI-CAGE-AT-0009]